MKPHGDCKVELINDVVHIFPIGGFNEEGIRDIRDRILSIAPIDKPWGLFEHPKDLAGVTPEAAEELLQTYLTISKFNCKVVALEVCSTWQGVLEKTLDGNLDIPYYFSNELEELNTLIQEHLDSM